MPSAAAGPPAATPNPWSGFVRATSSGVDDPEPIVVDDRDFTYTTDTETRWNYSMWWDLQPDQATSTDPFDTTMPASASGSIFWERIDTQKQVYKIGDGAGNYSCTQVTTVVWSGDAEAGDILPTVVQVTGMQSPTGAGFDVTVRATMSMNDGVETTTVRSGDELGVDVCNNGTTSSTGVWHDTVVMNFHSEEAPTDLMNTMEIPSMSYLQFEPTATATVELTRPDCQPPLAFFVTRHDTLEPRVTFIAAGDSGNTYRWDFDDGTTDAGYAVGHTFPEPEMYLVTLTVTTPEGCEARFTHDVVADPTTFYAPAVFLHPDEEYFPDTTDAFLDNSTLVWDRADVKDKSCPDDAIAGGVAVRRSGATRNLPLLDWFSLGSAATLPYTHLATQLNFRTSSSGMGVPDNCADLTGTVMSNDSIEQSAKSVRLDSGYVLNLADNWAVQNGDRSLTAPVYIEHVDGRYVIYWFFYPYNYWRDTLARINEAHEGDWEHVVVRLGDYGIASEMAWAQHTCAPTTRPWADVPTVGIDRPRPVVYSALGGHASYPEVGAGRHPSACFGSYDRTGEGPLWSTWENLVDATQQPWYGFGGNWGDRQSRSSYAVDFYGPPGPGPQKLAEDENVLPQGW